MYELFSLCGIELEYMIVSKDSLKVLPISDLVLKAAAGQLTEWYDNDEVSWSNELVLHVIELKTNGPAQSISNYDRFFAKNIKQINGILEGMGGMLLPSAMHPLMNPDTDMHLWNHGYREIYEAYNRIFDCTGHGWSNLQSTHINLPFSNDDEFGRLHAAIRVILPILPALAASSPFKEGIKTGSLDTRIQTYKQNQKKIPAITGQVIPEPCFSKKEYENVIFRAMFNGIAPFDKDHILQEEWLNSRGAIARFTRNAIEIRVIDIQECPIADLSIVSLVVETLKNLTSEAWSSYSDQKKANQEYLVNLLNSCADNARETAIDNMEYLSLFGLSKQVTSGELLKILADRMPVNSPYKENAQKLCEIDCLAARIIKATGDNPSMEKLRDVYMKLAQCLAANRFFEP